MVFGVEKMMGGGETDKDKMRNKIMSLMILTCYSTITLNQAKSVRI